MRDWVASLLQCTARTLDVRLLLQECNRDLEQQQQQQLYIRTHASTYAPNTDPSQSCVPHLTPSSSA